MLATRTLLFNSGWVSLVHTLHFIGTLEKAHATETGENNSQSIYFKSSAFIIRFEGPSLKLKDKTLAYVPLLRSEIHTYSSYYFYFFPLEDWFFSWLRIFYCWAFLILELFPSQLASFPCVVQLLAVAEALLLFLRNCWVVGSLQLPPCEKWFTILLKWIEPMTLVRHGN